MFNDTKKRYGSTDASFWQRITEMRRISDYNGHKHFTTEAIRANLITQQITSGL